MHSVSGTRTRLLALALTACCLGGSVAVAEAATTTGHHHHAKACRHHSHKHCITLPRHKPATSARGHTQASGGATHPTPPPPLPSSASAPFSPALTPASPTPSPTTPETPSGQAPPAGPAHVQVSAKEFNFTLSRAAAPAGHIDIELVDAGEDEHNLHIRPAAGGGPDVGALPTVQAGHHEDLEFNLPAGTYTFYCSMPGHEALGMKATFTVQ